MVDVIQVEPEARLEAVRRRLAQTRAKRVVLDLPADWRELDSAARLRLLQRQAQVQRCHLGLVTRDLTTRQAARQLGVPVFAQAKAALHDEWQMNPELPLLDLQNPARSLPEPPPWRGSAIVKRIARPSHHQARQRRIAYEAGHRRPKPTWLRLLTTTLIGLILAAPLLLFVRYVLPAATITLTPSQETITITVPLTANPNAAEPDFENNELPARQLESSLEVTGTLAATGSRQKASDKAAGTVTFSNLGNAPVRIPVGTVVNTGTGTSVSFRTTAPAELGGGVGARVDVPIEAVEQGIQGNVRANNITNVEGPLRFRVRVSNQSGTFGGDARLVPVVAQVDRDNLLAVLQNEANARSFATVSQELQPGEWLPAESVYNLVMSQAFSAFNDEEADQLDLTLRTLARGVAVDEAVTREALINALQKAIPAQGKLVADSLTLQRAPGASFIDAAVQFTMTVSARYLAPIDPREVRSAIADRPAGEAISLVQQRWPLARPPEIYQDPDWFGVLPYFGRRIQVRVDYGEPEGN